MVIIAAVAILALVQITWQTAADLPVWVAALPIAYAAAGLRPAAGQSLGRVPANVCSHIHMVVGGEATHQLQQVAVAPAATATFLCGAVEFVMLLD